MHICMPCTGYGSGDDGDATACNATRWSKIETAGPAVNNATAVASRTRPPRLPCRSEQMGTGTGAALPWQQQRTVLWR